MSSSTTAPCSARGSGARLQPSSAGTGFGFVSERQGHTRIPHVGGCIIEDDVEIGSHSCVDRGSLDDTRIGRGTKIDNQVHIAHNVHTGADCLIMACVGVAGSTRFSAIASCSPGSPVASTISSSATT